MVPRPLHTPTGKNMTHVIRAHGLFATAIEAVGRMQVNLVDGVREWELEDAMDAFLLLEEVDALCNKLDRGHCLGTADRELLIDCVTARRAALNVVGPTALAQQVMDECDAIINLAA